MEAFYPDPLSLDKPNPARMYDYALGGDHNFAIDRQAVEQLLQINPDTIAMYQSNRAFLRRAVEFLNAQGIDQFLDIGSGIPTVGNVHEIAQQANPDARVAYVDIDPVAIAHSRDILQEVPHAIAIQADARQPAEILAHPQVRALLNFDRPIALLLVTVLHYIPDNAQAEATVQTLCSVLVPGSYLVISHGTYDQAPPDVVARMERLMQGTSSPARPRSRMEILHFFSGLELVAPGLVHLPRWRPEAHPVPDMLPDPLEMQPERSAVFAGIARVP